MSVDLYALCTTELPSASAWHSAIAKQHFPLTMDSGFNPTRDSGFWPAKLEGKDTGFEYYPLLRSEWEHLPSLNQSSRFRSGVNLVTHSNLTEFVASILGAVALARACGGVVYDPQDGKSYEGSAMNDLIKQTELPKQIGGLAPPAHR